TASNGPNFGSPYIPRVILCSVELIRVTTGRPTLFAPTYNLAGSLPKKSITRAWPNRHCGIAQYLLHQLQNNIAPISSTTYTRFWRPAVRPSCDAPSV